VAPFFSNDGSLDTTPAESRSRGEEDRGPSLTGRARRMDNLLQNFQLLVEDLASITGQQGDEPVGSLNLNDPEVSRCTVSNWKSFLPCREFSGLGPGIYDTIHLPDEAPQTTAPVFLTKRGGMVDLEIQSSYLQKQFRKVASIESFYEVSLLASSILIRQPYAPLYHELENIKANIENDSHASPSDLNSLHAICYFYSLGLPKSRDQAIRTAIGQGFIQYGDLWALYRPNDYVVSKDPVGNYTVSQIGSVKYEEDIFTHIPRNRWFVTTVQMAWSSGKYLKVTRKRRIESYEGGKKIQDLEFYPLKYHTDQEGLRELALNRGKTWRQYCDGDPRVMTYNGQALPLTKDVHRERTYGFYSQPIYNTVSVSLLHTVDVIVA
jgi:hypothetical protein